MLTRSEFLYSSGAVVVAASGSKKPAHPPANDLMTRLMQGNARYIAGKTIHGDHTARRDEVSGGQHPWAMILSCADSRVPPELIFDQSLGDLFVVRVAGNYAETGGIGSFEFAFANWHSPLLMVLGHSSCGAVHAAVDAMNKPGPSAPGDIAAIVNAIMPAAKAVKGKPGDEYTNAIAENVRRNVAALKAQKPLLNEGVSAKKLQVVGAVYDLKSGSVRLV